MTGVPGDIIDPLRIDMEAQRHATEQLRRLGEELAAHPVFMEQGRTIQRGILAYESRIEVLRSQAPGPVPRRQAVSPRSAKASR